MKKLSCKKSKIMNGNEGNENCNGRTVEKIK